MRASKNSWELYVTKRPLIAEVFLIAHFPNLSTLSHTPRVDDYMILRLLSVRLIGCPPFLHSSEHICDTCSAVTRVVEDLNDRHCFNPLGP